ncbi:MAG: leucine-rich repeat domain-containing protein [Prevotella sp.]|nr:leucine-rich repeat domain-containing protein [Prevotella sp.]
MTSVTIPNSVTSIGYQTFSGCSGLTSVTIPNSVTSIEDLAFSGCSGLISVTIPNSVTSIGYGVFSGCSGLTSVTIPNSVTSIGSSAFSGCSSLTSVTIPNSVTSIDNYAFRGCSGLTSVTIPNNVTSIDDYAFYGCSGLNSVVIGGGVETIWNHAFANCPDLTDVTCYAEKVPFTQRNVFEGSYIEYATLHVPTASIDAYKTTVPWSSFKTFMGLDGTLPDTPDPELPKCATPIISYGGKKLTFSCETEGVEYVYEIKDSDIRKGYESEVSLTATYEISVYATKPGYENSDIATATLVWGSANFTETTGTTSARPLTLDVPMLIMSQGGVVTIEGANDGERITVYSINGTQAGSAISKDGSAVINSNLQPGNVAIIRIGQKSVKMMVK